MELEPSESEFSAPDSSSAQSWAWVGLTLLLVLHGLVNLWWLGMDQHGVRSGEASAMLTARSYYEAVYANPGASVKQRLIDITLIPLGNPAQGPLLPILGATAIAVFGYGTDAMASVGTVAFLLAILGMYLFARRFLTPMQSLFAATVFSLVPAIFAASRVFMTDYLTMCLCVWAVYCLVRSGNYLSTPWVVAFSVINGLGILSQPNAFYFYLFPCLAPIGAGLWHALRGVSADQRDGSALRAWVLNGSLSVVIAAGIFGPWYYHQMETIHAHWAEIGRGNPDGPLTFAEPPPPGTISNVSQVGRNGSETDLPRAPAPSTASIHSTPLQQALERIEQIGAVLSGGIRPSHSWLFYPTHVANNASFFVLFALSILGLLTVPLWRNSRSQAGLILVLWLLGSWLLLTALWRVGAPRYTLPALPALGMLAALPVLAVPWDTLRRTIAALLLAVLGFQFVNLTFFPAGPIARAHLPWRWDAAAQDRFHDPAVVLYKDSLSLSDAYTALSRPDRTGGQDYKDRLFRVAVSTEQQRPFISGANAYYLRLGLHGMEFHQNHYWPEPNPYRLRSIAAEDLPKRRLLDLGFGQAPEALVPQLNQADYVMYAMDTSDATTAAQWDAWFAERGFVSIERFPAETPGTGKSRVYGIYAKDLTDHVQTIATNADIDNLDLNSLFMLRQNPDFAGMPEALRAYAELRFRALADPQGNAVPMNDAVSLVNATMAPTGESGIFEFQFTFKVAKAMPDDWKIYFWGYVSEEDQHLLPEAAQKAGFESWNFDPAPPTSRWREGDYVIVTHRIKAVPLLYNFRFGFYRGENEMYGRDIMLPNIELKANP